MIRPKAFEKPSGMRDYLPRGIAQLRHIEFEVLGCMQQWGYREVLTPTLEFYDTVGIASATAESKQFKLLDRRGVTMVMRSDLTAPIARMASSVLRDEPLPLRLAYHANVFRAIEEDAGREAEFFQTGAELIGDEGAAADAEVIALAIACLQAAGVEEFRIAAGHVGFLEGLLQEMLPSRPAVQARLRARLLQRDYVGYRREVVTSNVPRDVQTALEQVLELRGGKEICEQARSLVSGPAAHASINDLSEVWEILEAHEVSEHVLIDLTMTGDFSYYTGMTFEGYASSLGFAVCNGGRYDNLTAQFGRPASATGFALRTDRILDAVGADRAPGSRPLLLCYDAPHRQEALARARRIRKQQGKAVETRQVRAAACLERLDSARYDDVLWLVDEETSDG